MSATTCEKRIWTAAMQSVAERFERPLEEELAERYRRQTADEIARDLGVSRQTVINWLRAFGIRTRFGGQRPPLRNETAPATTAGER